MADLFFGGSPFRRLLYARPLASATAAMDWVETPTSHVLRINVPGLGKDDVKVQVEDGNVLSVRGAAKEKGNEGNEEAAVWHVAERGKPEFAREVALPEHVRVEQIRASVDNGELIVVVPKEPAPARPRTRPIAVSSKL
ncbi:16.0 kDa heat shock protein, peroxisomal-like [Triticum dicoccoides]|uniref:16.0 kDa heat shock protein, peroxisomal-like n=1 Tax=Triticum dicoccoides TaxID=85692 RepID=UPI0018911676|nr:16.0 kDa heat shock protein, peroxisomal-like [Triticum dicoccoides]